MVKGTPVQPLRALENLTDPSSTENSVLSEINLLRYPFCIISKNQVPELWNEATQKKRSHIIYEVTDSKGNKRVWKVNPTLEYGYNTPFDKKVLTTVQKVVTDDGFPPPILYKLGSLRRLCKAMKKTPNGRNIKRIRESLIRISATNIYTETFYLKRSNGYWKAQQRRQGGSFSLWSVFWREDELPIGQVADAVYLQFNVPFILSLQDFYVKPLDFDYWLGLPPLAQRLYEVTGLKFYGLKDSGYISFSYLELCQALPIKQQHYLSVARRILERAHRKLMETNWLQQVEWVEDEQTDEWIIRYYPGLRAYQELAQSRERLRRFQAMRQRQAELPEWQDVQAWANLLTEELQDARGKNRGFYIKIGRLISQGRIRQDFIWEAVSNAKVEDREGNVKKSRSAFFTDYLKRRLKERGQDLNQLLKAV